MSIYIVKFVSLQLL